MKKRALIFCGIVAIAFSSCTSDSDTGTYVRNIDRPWENIDVPEQVFSFNAELGDTLELENGTVIRIPGGILLDSKGEHIRGMAEIVYREMYTPASIIASGIPMDYDSAGSNYSFQSAGMFDINANQNGEPLTIENGKSISMDFATTRNDMTYSFYRYDTVGNAWDFQNVPEVDTNMKRAALSEEIAAAEAAAPVKPIEYNGKDPVIDLEFDLQKHPELSGYDGIIWQYAGGANNPEENKWIYQEVWGSADLDLADRNQGTYSLNLKNSNKSFYTLIRPVLKGADYENAIAEFTMRMEKFESEEAARREEAARVEQMPPYMSRLNVLVFGVHNLDCIRHNPDFIFANVKYIMPDFTGSRGNVTVYIVSGFDQTTLAYNAAVNTCYYRMGASNKVIAVDHTTGKSFTMSSSDFNTSVKSGSKSITLTLKENNTQVSDMAALEKVINEL